MREICKFCGRGNPDEEGCKPIIHTDECARNQARAHERYTQGWNDGRYGTPPKDHQKRDSAYMAGWLAGEIALENWFNGDDHYNE